MSRLELPDIPVTWTTDPSPSGNDVHVIGVPSEWPEGTVREDGLTMLVWVSGKKRGRGRLRLDSDRDLSGTIIAHRGEDLTTLRPHKRTAGRFIADIGQETVETILGPR